MPVTYVVKKSEAENIEDVIVKTGHEQIISPSGVRSYPPIMEKNIKAAQAQIALEQAKMDNVEHFHEIVKSLTDEQMCAIALYAQAKGVRDQFVEKLAEFEKEYAAYKTEVAEIEAQTGLDLHTMVEEPKPMQEISRDEAAALEAPKVD